MLRIKNEDVKIAGHYFDYELEDGTLLHSSEWNGEDYTLKINGVEAVYKPVYKEVDEDEYEIIGFEKW